MRFPVVVGFRLPEPVEREFQARLDARFLDSFPREAGALRAALDGVAALVVTPPIKADAWLFEHLPPSIRALATYSVGLDHVDLAAAKRRGLPVVHTPDVLTDAVAETAMLLLLGAMRRATESIALIHSREWQGWNPRQIIGQGLDGKTLGILGMGRIGRTIARRARGFDMAVHYHNRSRLAPEQEEGACYHAAPEALMAESDVLVLAAPSSAATRRILDARRIALLPPGAVVVNIARGDLVDDDALIAALTAGRIGGAGLDVFNGEPRLDERYLSLPNVFLQPHQGSSTLTARLRMGQILLDGIDAVLSGRPASNRLV